MRSVAVLYTAVFLFVEIRWDGNSVQRDYHKHIHNVSQFYQKTRLCSSARKYLSSPFPYYRCTLFIYLLLLHNKPKKVNIYFNTIIYMQDECSMPLIFFVLCSPVQPLEVSCAILLSSDLV